MDTWNRIHLKINQSTDRFRNSQDQQSIPKCDGCYIYSKTCSNFSELGNLIHSLPLKYFFKFARTLTNFLCVKSQEKSNNNSSDSKFDPFVEQLWSCSTHHGKSRPIPRDRQRPYWKIWLDIFFLTLPGYGLSVPYKKSSTAFSFSKKVPDGPFKMNVALP